MIRYVPSSAAAPLTKALWSLAKPVQYQNSSGTKEMFSFIDDLQSPPKRWLIVDTDFEITIHKDAELAEIKDILLPWVKDGLLPERELLELSSLIEKNRDSRLNIYNSFPSLFKNLSKSYEDMLSSGFLDRPLS